MKTTMKKTLAILIAMIVVLGMLPVSVLATGAEESTVTEVDTYDELVKAVQKGCEIKLVGDVVMAGRAGISIDTVLDLNGYTISIAEEAENNPDLFLVIGGSTLTVKDTSEAGTGTIDATNATDSAIWASAGSVVLNSGYIKQGNSERGLYTAVSLTLNGGKVDRVSYNSGTITIGADMVLEGTVFDGINPATSEHVTGFNTDEYQITDNMDGTYTVTLKSDSGETEEPTEPEGGIPTDAVEITESDIEGQPEALVGMLGTYDAESGWVPFEASSADTVQYNCFITDLNAGDVIYLDFSAPTDYAFGNIEGMPTQGTADGIVEVTADVSGAYAAIAFSNVTLRAYVVSAPEGGDSGSDEGGDNGSTDGEVGTYDELADALEVGGNIKLTGDIELPTGLDVMADTTLDLNGYTLSVAEGASVTDVLYLNEGVTLTVEDSSTEGTGVTDGTGMIDGTGASDSAIWASAGSVILNGGYIKQGDSGYGLYTCVSLTLNGGRIDRVCHSAGTITIGVDMALEGTVFEGINPATSEHVTGFDTDEYQITDNMDSTYTVTLKSDSGDVEEPTEPEEPTTITVYFQNNWLWTEVYLYYGTPDGDSPAWRGEAMTWYDNDGNYDIYSYELPADASYFVISGLKDDGSGNTDQTPDISTEGIYDGICYYMMWDNGNMVGSESIDVILPPVVDPEPDPEPEPDPTTVVAWVDTDGDGAIDEGETTYTDLTSALSAGGEIKLAADVVDFTYVHNTGDLTLDLNGYTVTLNGWLDVYDGASLTIKDSSTPSTGRIVCTEAINCYLDVYSDGRLLLKSGTVDVIRLNGEYSDVSLEGGTVGKMIVSFGLLKLGENATVTAWAIDGGKFFSDPSDYLADGYVATLDEETGYYVVTEGSSESDPGLELRSASVALGSDISIIFKMFIPSERVSSAGLSITMNGKQTLLYAQEAEALGEDVYAFTFTGIAPQQMGDTLTVEVITLDGNNVTGVWDTREYSVKQNAMNLMTAYADNEALMTLLGDLLTYGAAAQVYKSYRTDALVTDGLTLSTSTATPSADDAMVITGNESTDAYFSAAGLWFDSYNNLYVKITATDEAALDMYLYVNDHIKFPYEMESLGDGVYKFTGEALRAIDFATDHVFVLHYGEQELATLTYSVNAYAYGILQSETESEEMKALALALYRYGASATAYASGDEVTTVTEAEITLEQTEYIYSDSYIEPAVTSVVVNGVTLSEGNDYTVSYSDNYYVGTATVTVTFCGSYAGTVTTTFEIIQDPATEDFGGEWVSIGG